MTRPLPPSPETGAAEASAPPVFNPFSRRFRADPYAVFAELQAHAPVHRSGDLVVLTRYEPVKRVLADPRFGSASVPLRIESFRESVRPGQAERLTGLGRKAIVFTDGGDHVRLRRLAGQPFTSAAIAALERAMETEVWRLLDALQGKLQVEFIGEFANLLPLRVLARAMGLPPEHDGDVDGWTLRLRALLEPGLLTAARLTRILDALDNAFAFFLEQIAARRTQPRADFISQWLAARTDSGDRLADDEIVYACLMTFVAGKETTKCLLGSGLLALLQHPEELALLRQDRALLPKAVDEMLRHEAPLQQTMRVCNTAAEIEGMSIAPGEKVLLCMGAANRDERAFPDPHAFRIRREGPSHLAFGYGIHNCLGGLLATRMAHRAFGALLDAWPHMALDPTPVEWIDTSFILRGPKQLRLTLS